MRIAWEPFQVAIKSNLGGYYMPTIEAGGITLDVGAGSYDRYDVIYVQQRDYQANASYPDSEVYVGVAKGTASSRPSVPSIPDSAVAVFTIRVRAGVRTSNQITTADITRAAWVAPVGGIVSLDGDSEVQAFETAVKKAGSASASTPLYATVDGTLTRFDGAVWTAMAPTAVATPQAAGGSSKGGEYQPLIQYGTSVVKTDGEGDARVTLPRRFSGGITSVVVTNGDASDATGAGCHLTIRNIDDTGSFVIRAWRHTGGKLGWGMIRVNYIAMGW